VSRRLLSSVLASLVLAASSGGASDGGLEWPAARSPAPTAFAWKGAPRIAVRRAFGVRARECAVHRVAEWVQVRCPKLKTPSITEPAGDKTGVAYHVDPPGDDRVPGGGHVTFPVRRGDRRVFLFWTLGPGYDGPLTVIPAVVVQESWPAGSAQPVLTLTDALHEPVGTATHPRPSKSKGPDDAPSPDDVPAPRPFVW
jgi:hypothetical protein